MVVGLSGHRGWFPIVERRAIHQGGYRCVRELTAVVRNAYTRQRPRTGHGVQLIEAAQARWRAVNAPHLVAPRPSRRPLGTRQARRTRADPVTEEAA
jgi:hypothetical protein